MTPIIRVSLSTAQKPRCTHCRAYTLPTEPAYVVSRGPNHHTTCAACLDKEGPITRSILATFSRDS